MATTTNIGLTKPAGTDKALVSVINSNSDIIDSAAGGLMDAIAIVANGNTHAAISAGQYVYVHNHGTLAEGLYTANSAIAANATLTTSNLTADASGGLNALNSKLDSKFRIITSGSMHDLAGQNGIFWMTSAVTDKPFTGAGILVLNSYNTSYCTGIAVDVDACKAYTISYANNVWTSHAVTSIDSVTVSGTSSGTGAIDIPNAYKGKLFINALLTTGDPGFVVRRDVNYFTVFNNNGTPKTNTSVVFDAYFSL